MILGRPVNLWLGVTTALAGFLTVVAISAGADPTLVANIAGAGAGVMGAIIALIAGQAPTVNAGDTVNVVTPKGQDNFTVKV